MQTSRDLSYNTKLKITTAKYYIPSGRCIQALDYTHRNVDGSVGHIPDSLITKFKTKNGRIVYDGGGVIPDIKIESNKISSVEKYLLLNHIIFDYVTKFKSENTNIDSINDYKLKDATFNDFVKYVEKRNIEYKTESDVALNKLLKSLKKENYYERVSVEVKTLEKKLKHSVAEDLYFYKDNISNYLSAEIINRYYFQNGVIEYMLKENKEKKEAIKVLNDINKYNKILTVK